MIKNIDCIKGMQELEENSIDAIVTDPPYGLGFMGKEWDSIKGFQKFNEEWGVAALRVLKPGGYALVFGGSRTYHRMVSGLEDAGFEVRDCIMWIYSSGFPKGLNISKGIDKRLGVESPEAKQWEGWHTNLKPAYEPVAVLRKPLESSVVDAVLKYGTGGLNIDACRVPTADDSYTNRHTLRKGPRFKTVYVTGKQYDEDKTWVVSGNDLGRFPANVILDEVAGDMLDEQSGEVNTSWGFNADNLAPCSKDSSLFGFGGFPSSTHPTYNDKGGASRFFYCPKASTSERNAGCEDLVEQDGNISAGPAGMSGTTKSKRNFHPTVKPVALMRYLVKLTCKPRGVVLDPFLGSGTTCMACKQEGMKCVGFEMEKEYYDIAAKRLAALSTVDMWEVKT